MRIFLFVLFGIAFLAVVWWSSNPKVEVPGVGTVKLSALTDEQKIGLLTQEASARHLAWHIFCTRFKLADPEGFQGTAYFTDTDSYDETSDRWMKSGATQADAAYALYVAIKGSPTHPGHSKETDAPYNCPLPELRSAK